MTSDPTAEDKAFEAGVEARQRNLTDTTSPYTPGSDLHRIWLEGWHEGDALDETEAPPVSVTARDPGYYWVEGADKPEVAYWDGKNWGYIGMVDASDIPNVISETPIVPPKRVSGMF